MDGIPQKRFLDLRTYMDLVQKMSAEGVLDCILACSYGAQLGRFRHLIVCLAPTGGELDMCTFPRLERRRVVETASSVSAPGSATTERPVDGGTWKL